MLDHKVVIVETHRIRLELLLVTFCVMLFAVSWAMINGRDLNWDFLNYHIYAGFSASGARLKQDYFPAGIQSYMPGFAYVPLYQAIHNGWSTWAVQILLGFLSVPTMIATWLLGYRILPVNDRESVFWRLIMLVFACGSPLFLSELGTSFIDAPTSALVLFALVLSLPSPFGVRSWHVPCAGILTGVACALKMTNAPMVVGIVGIYALVTPGTYRRRAILILQFGAMSAVAFLLVYGDWGRKLFLQFENPFFPIFLNEVFKPSEYLHESISLDRFKPMDLKEFLFRPVYMLDLVPNIYTETKAPDARYLVIIILFVGYWIERCRRQIQASPPLEAMLLWCGVTWVIWLLTSGNGRYAIPLAMVTGVASVGLAERLWWEKSNQIKIIKMVCIALFGLQVAVLSQATTYRWDGRTDSASKKYFSPEVNLSTVNQAHIIVNLDVQSVSWLAPFVHPDSVFINPTGQYLIKPSSNAGQRLHKLLSSEKPILVSFKSNRNISNNAVDSRGDAFRKFQSFANLYGLRVDLSGCHNVVMDRSKNPVKVAAISLNAKQENSEWSEQVIALCPAEFDPLLSEVTELQYTSDEEVFNLLEDFCPNLFRPKRVQTSCLPHFCGRFYVNTDMTIMVHADGGVVATTFGGIQPAWFGNKTELLGSRSAKCPSKPGKYIPFSAGDAVAARQQ